ncbi:MAG: NADH-quinone oxidoreductase subunit N [Desulfovibrio sp.]|jgi:NADH-quinone oxidoreductase subunit N|nr:NADH-quinone oxidoreductase subunit N [Desulfovibrio sp.]
MSADLVLFAPELAQGALLLALFGLILARPRQDLALSWLPAASVGVLAASLLAMGARGVFFSGAYQLDACSQFFKAAVALGAALANQNALRRPLLDGERRTEYFFLLSLSALGFMVLASAVEIITLVVALELASYSLFALVPLRGRDPRAAEAGIKYILFGAAATGLSLYGYAYIMGTQHTGLIAQLAGKDWSLATNPGAVMGMALLLCGFLYKLALFPFHAWAPDVYTGADNETSAYLATIPKLGAAVVLVRFMAVLTPAAGIGQLLAVLGVLSMTIGNLAALAQKDLKRMLGYSGVAHAGYLTLGLAAGSAEGMGSVAHYSLVYVLGNLACFWVICRLSRDGRNLTYADLSGLHKRRPALAFLMALAAFSLVGLPPTAGFMGKLFLLSSAWNAGYSWLVVAAVVNTAISIYFYLNLARHCYTVDPEREDTQAEPAGAAGFVLAGAILALGVVPGPVFNLALKAGQNLLP